MNVNYDIWSGESIQELIHTLAEFRLQMPSNKEGMGNRLSEEIIFLQHYLDSESTIIVANDCGAMVGYMAIVEYSDFHSDLSQYQHYGPDMKISEGPWVHPSYQNMGIAKGLMQESLTVCDIKLISLLIIDPPEYFQVGESSQRAEGIARFFGFRIEPSLKKKVFKKELVIESAYQ